jgi:KaiC/GvpD/RAD55 family RecA-like ATPase
LGKCTSLDQLSVDIFDIYGNFLRHNIWENNKKTHVMKKRIQIIPSGLSLVDKSWGGFYTGGTYLLIGAKKSGKTMYGLKFAMECAAQKEVCLYFTSMRPKDLMILAASIDVDLQDYMNQNLIIVVRVAPPKDIFSNSGTDEFYAEYLRDIVTVVDKYKPSKIVFDELTPFISFNNINLLKQTFLKTIDVIENSGITSMFILGEPATPAARQIVDVISGFATGTIYLQKDDINEFGGVINIAPNVGHNEGKFSTVYSIEPYKGIVEQVSEPPKIEQPVKSLYKSLLDYDVPEEDFSSPNIYNISDFELILNNQIAVYKTTGQVFTLISFRIDPAQSAVKENQLFNAVRLSIDRKDKLCKIDNLQLVLLMSEDQRSINSVIGKVKKNLPAGEDNIADILKSVSVYVIKVDSTISNAEDILKRVISGENQEKSKFGYY